MLAAGQQAGSYRIVRLLGEGGMGAVYEAEHVLIGRRAAVKVMHPELSSDLRLTHRFLNEARAANRVRHPGLVEVYEFGQLPDGTPYLIMELLEGETLQRRLERNRGRLPQSLRIARSIALAIGAAHEASIIHRDLKPQNVMLVADPERPDEERVKVLDFGIAKLTDSGTARGAQLPALRTRSGVTMGTPEYMAPEQCSDASQVDTKADVYALGIMLYEMLVGERPFESDLASEVMTMQVRAAARPVRERAPDLSPELAALVHRMLAKQPAERPSMAAVAELLQPWELEPIGSPEGAGSTQRKEPVRTEPSMSSTPVGEAGPRVVEELQTPQASTDPGRRYGLFGLVMAASLAGVLGILYSQKTAQVPPVQQTGTLEAAPQRPPMSPVDAGTERQGNRGTETQSAPPERMTATLAGPTGPETPAPRRASPETPDPSKVGKKRPRAIPPAPTLVVPLFRERPDAP